MWLRPFRMWLYPVRRSSRIAGFVFILFNRGETGRKKFRYAMVIFLAGPRDLYDPRLEAATSGRSIAIRGE